MHAVCDAWALSHGAAHQKPRWMCEADRKRLPIGADSTGRPVLGAACDGAEQRAQLVCVYERMLVSLMLEPISNAR